MQHHDDTKCLMVCFMTSLLEETFDMITVVPLFNFEKRNNQHYYAKNRTLLLL